MRTIKFKAKAVSGEWVYGNFIHSERFSGYSNEYRIHEPMTGMEHDVLPETVGEFTGLFDKNGKEIYEGDILCHKYHSTLKREIKWFKGCFTVEWNDFNWGSTIRFDFSDYEIIGNIYENPELLQL